MKRLRFRTTRPSETLRCGSVFAMESNGDFPRPFTWGVGGAATADLELTNNTGVPIRMKVFVDGVLTWVSPYIGDTMYQTDLDIYNNNNLQPQEIIHNAPSATYNIDVPVGTMVVVVKVYCPLIKSAFGLTLTCT